MNDIIDEPKNITQDTKALNIDVTTLFARISFGLFMLLGHGWFKLKLWMSGRAVTFAVCLGLGPEIELAMAIFAEVFCAICVIIGFQTRLATIPLIITMIVAAFVYHWGDAFFYLPQFSSNKEFALVYAIGFSIIFMLGSGKYSLDYIINQQKK